MANLKTERFQAVDVIQLPRALQQGGTPADARIWLGFALAKAYEDQNANADAFRVLEQANAWKRQTIPWDSAAEHVRTKEIAAAFSSPLPDPLEPTLGEEVIFIVSLPRSDTTLTKQILASHPWVEGASEITDLPQVIADESMRRGKPFPQWVNDATAGDWLRLGRDCLART